LLANQFGLKVQNHLLSAELKTQKMDMDFNWAAYGVAVLAQMIIGFIWFHPAVMGKMWAASTGMTLEDMKPKNPALTYGLTTLYTLLITMFMMVNVVGPGQDATPEGHSFHTFQHGAFHAIILTIMVVIPMIGTPALFEKKGFKYMLVQVGYWFVRMAVAMGILSVWR
jgi:Protein of unknown function (DUF1761)